MIIKTSKLSLFFVALALSFFVLGCSDNNNDSDDQGLIDQDLIRSYLVASTDGGSNGVGAWTLIDGDTLLPVTTLAETEGGPIPLADLVSNTDRDVSGDPIGFAFNRVDGWFYGIIPGAGFDGVTPPGRSVQGIPGKVIRFNPTTDTIESLATIPGLYLTAGTEPLSDYFTAPVVSPDGKSLMLVAQWGGPEIPLPVAGTNVADTIGALVHLDIDPASSDYLTFTPVYGFYEYGVSQAWNAQLHRVNSWPLLAETPGQDIIFLISRTSAKDVGGSTEYNPYDAFSLTPGDVDDWSQPWTMVGTPYGTWADPAPQPWYDPIQNEFWWGAEALDGTQTFFCRREGPDGTVTQNDVFIMNNIFGAGNPQAMYTGPSGETLMLTAGVGPGAGYADLTSYAKFVELDFILGATIRETLEVYWTGYDDRQIPAGLASSPKTGYNYVTAVSNPDAAGLNDYLYVESLNDHTSASDFVNADLNTLYADANVLPSRLDRYDYSNFQRANIFEGTVNDGYILAGVPAIGGLSSEPLSDRYVLALSVQGGLNGYGALIKYDRVTSQVVSVPLGNSTPGLPVGQAIQLDNGLLLGGSEVLVGAGLTPQKSTAGIWVMDMDSAANAQDFALPSTDIDRGIDTYYTEAYDPPLAFAKTSDGGIWATVKYKVWEPGVPAFHPGYTAYVTGLVAFDPDTGEPTGELHIYGDSQSWFYGSFSSITARDNILTFVSPALRVEDANVEGERVWVVDLDDRDVDNKPASNFVLLDKNGSGATGNAWAVVSSPTLESVSGDFYFITSIAGDVGELRIHKMEVGASVAAPPVLTTVVTGLTDIAGTSLLQASDGLFYYGTRTGKLMRFDPSDDSVTQVADLAASGMTSDCRGFLSELDGGIVAGVVTDSSAAQIEVATRAFRYVIATQAVSSVDMTGLISEQDSHPGILPVYR